MLITPSRSLQQLLTGLGLALLLPLAAPAQDRAGQEITYPGEAFAKLDTFEGLNLQDADKLYHKKDYKGAFAAYKAYSFEFARSRALPYVLLRMGRCLHQLEKRNAAIKAYQDVVDYFPDDVRYAAAALFYIGQCHAQNGDEARQTAVWARMVKDDGYVSQPNSGTALTYLGKAMEKLGKFDEATEYHWRTAINFLESNPDAARDARQQVIYHYVSRRPNHDKLKEFHIAASGFDGRGVNTDKPEEDVRYWSTALSTALGIRDDEQARAAACAYWSAKMGDRFVEHDDLRKKWADAHLVHGKDPQAWLARMKRQFDSKPKTADRVVQWCAYFQADEDLRSKFFAEQGQPLLVGLNNEEKTRLMNQLRHPLGMHDEARQVMRTVDTRGMGDEELGSYANFAANYEPEETVLRYFGRMKDPLAAASARFDYYRSRSHHNAPNAEKALAEIPALRKSPEHAGVELSWQEGRLLQGLGRHEEAIKAYRAANKQPDSTWAITDCLAAMKNYPEAIRTVRELESVGGSTASRACLRISEIHRSAGDKAREVDQLRLVLKRYPKSGESSEAHRRLESYGVALIGGEAEAEE